MTLLNIYMGGLCVAIVYWFIAVYCMIHDGEFMMELIEGSDKAWLAEVVLNGGMWIGFVAYMLWPIVLVANVILIVDFLLRN